MPALRHKSLALTDYLERLVLQLAGDKVAVITPTEHAQRGCQLSLRARSGASSGRELFERLSRSGVVCDWREPDVLRLAPVPLYNGFEDVLRAAWRLSEILPD